MAPLRSTDDPAREADSLAIFASGDPPAFATDERHRITLWNAGAERLLRLRSEDVLGKLCFEVIRGRDIFGNCFCYERCPLVTTVTRGEPPHAFDLIARTAQDGEQTFSVTTVGVRGREQMTLVHVLRRRGHHARRPGLVEADQTTPALLDDMARLTCREREILCFVASGLQNKEIAQRLGISFATVRNHVHNVLEKLGVHSKLEAASLAYRCGWVERAR